MHIDFTPEQKALRQELRAYYRKLFSEGDLRQRLDDEWDMLGGPAFREAMGRMGKDGWLVIGWPEEWGGQGRTHLEQFIFWDETWRARAPLPVITVNTVGPMVMQWGSDDQKAELLPKIRDGELIVSIGYTEPGSGTDLASLSTSPSATATTGSSTARRSTRRTVTRPTTSGSRAAPIRTRRSTRAFRSSSCRRTTPAIRTRRSGTIGGEVTYATFYENIRVPVANTIGPVNGGWGLITGQLNLERITLSMPASLEGLFEDVWTWACETDAPGGGKVADAPWVQQQLASVYARVEALKLMNWHSAWLMDQGAPGMAESSAVKVFGTENVIGCYRDLLEITGPAGLGKRGQSGALFDGLLESAYRLAMVNTFGGGVNEVMRDIIAAAGLQAPARATLVREESPDVECRGEEGPRGDDGRVRRQADRPAGGRARRSQPAHDPSVV